MNAYDTMFAIDCIAGALSLISIGGLASCHFSNHRLRDQRDEAIEALRNEEAEGAHWRELAEDALANVEDLRERLNQERASAGRYAGKLLIAEGKLAEIARSEEARRAHMRRIAILGNKSPRRKREAA